jgi:hypothetical protein
MPRSWRDDSGPLSLGDALTDAIAFWEKWRFVYNVVLAGVVMVWLVSSWPHFRPAFTFSSLGMMFVLAVLANVAYCAAYLADVPMQLSAFRPRWRKHWRWVLWLIGTITAALLAHFWIATQIYPYLEV